MKKFLIYLLAGILLNSASHGKADPIVSALPGHREDSKNLLASKLDVILAKFISLGNGGLDSLGGVSFGDAPILVEAVFRGSPSKNLNASYFVKSDPGVCQEMFPALNIDYIMFIKKMSSTECKIYKILPATESNIAKVKALIAAAPAEK